MMRVLVADDHALVRKGLKEIIDDTIDMRVVGEAINGLEVLEMVHKDDWDVLVLDMSLPLRNGMEVLGEVRHIKPNLPVLVLSFYSEQQYGIRVLKAGAAGYLSKSTGLTDIVGAIRKVVSGGKYISPELAEYFVAELSSTVTKAPHEMLSDREYTVMCMIGQGKQPTAIAQELALSVKTVSTYRTRVLHKLGLKSNAEMIRYVIEHNLV